MQVQYQETIKIDFVDARYPNLKEVAHLSLKDAHELSKQLSEVLSRIPF